MIGDVESRLRTAGLSAAEAERKRWLFADAGNALDAMADAGRHDGEAHAFWVPGRIEFLGKHTDYAGGRSLLCTVERGICLVARGRADTRVRIVDAATGEQIECAFDAPANGRPGHWATYPSTVVARLARNFAADGGAPLMGADMAFQSDLPIAAGMSSSSALVVATFLALSTVNDLPSRDAYRRNISTDEDLAGYAGALESGLDFHDLGGDLGVGTLSGSEDQTAMVCSRPGMLVQYSFCPVRFERALRLPPRHVLFVASSGVTAEKTASALPHYNALARKARAVVSVWRARTGGTESTIGEVLAAHPSAATELPAMLRGSECDGFTGRQLVDRFEQFYHESAVIIPTVADALERDDLRTLGVLIDRSVARAAALLENQIPETLALARIARSLGAVAASPFGAGWGGSVWALVPEAEREFAEAWRSAYLETFPSRADRAEFFETRAGPAALKL